MLASPKTGSRLRSLPRRPAPTMITAKPISDRENVAGKGPGRPVEGRAENALGPLVVIPSWTTVEGGFAEEGLKLHAVPKGSPLQLRVMVPVTTENTVIENWAVLPAKTVCVLT